MPENETSIQRKCLTVAELRAKLAPLPDDRNVQILFCDDLGEGWTSTEYADVTGVHFSNDEENDDPSIPDPVWIEAFKWYPEDEEVKP